VLFEVTLRRLVGVVVGMKMMGVCSVSVVRRLLVLTRLVVLGCFLVMTGSMFVVFSSLRVMLCGPLRHDLSLVLS
jgi:hypothetical protein